jgi:hypothetical protein
MKKIAVLIVVCCSAIMVRATSIDSLYIANGDTSQTVFVSYTATMPSFLFVQRDTVSDFQTPTLIASHSVVVGVFSDTIANFPLLPNTRYFYRAMLSDGIMNDTLIDSLATLASPAQPAVLANMLASSITQTGALLTVDFNSGGSAMFIDWKKSLDSGITWTTIAVHSGLNGFSTDSLSVTQNPNTTVWYIARGWNLSFPTQPDTANSVVVVTYPIWAQRPNIDSLSVSLVDQTGGMLYVGARADSVGSTLIVNTSENAFGSGGTINPVTVFGTPYSVFDTTVWISGYGANTNVYVQVITINQIGTDTAYIDFLTSPIVIGPPTMSTPVFTINGNYVTVESSCASFDPYPNTLVGFEIAYHSDTNVIILNSGIDTLTTPLFQYVFGPLPDGHYMVRGWIFNSQGFIQTAFVPFDITLLGITHPESVLIPERTYIYDIQGKFIREEMLFDVYMYIYNSDLPAGIYMCAREGEKTIKVSKE